MSLTAGPQPPDFIAQLMMRYWGIGKDLNNDEREVLLFALSTENQALNGSIYRQAKVLFKARFPKIRLEP